MLQGRALCGGGRRLHIDHHQRHHLVSTSREHLATHLVLEHRERARAHALLAVMLRSRAAGREKKLAARADECSAGPLPTPLCYYHGLLTSNFLLSYFLPVSTSTLKIAAAP